jgi:hypothetical protein
VKAAWKLGAAGALELTVDDGDRKHQWTLRKSHSPEKVGQALAEAARILLATNPGLPSIPLPGFLQSDNPGKVLVAEARERIKLRLQAEAALAGAASAKAIMDGDEGEVAKIPEVMGRTSEKDQTNTAGFTLPQAPSAAIDGTTYSNQQYRSDKSNWIR